MVSDLNMLYGKMAGFVFFSIVWLTLVKKLRNPDFESHWNTLIYFDKKNILSNLNMTHGKISDFVSFLFLGFTLVVKLRNFEFKGH